MNDDRCLLCNARRLDHLLRSCHRQSRTNLFRLALLTLILLARTLEQHTHPSTRELPLLPARYICGPLLPILALLSVFPLLSFSAVFGRLRVGDRISFRLPRLKRSLLFQLSFHQHGFIFQAWGETYRPRLVTHDLQPFVFPPPSLLVHMKLPRSSTSARPLDILHHLLRGSDCPLASPCR